MKKLELKFGTPLTKEQMRKVAGGFEVGCGYCTTCMCDGSSFDTPGTYDPDTDSCDMQEDKMQNCLNAGLIAGYSCTDGDGGGDMSCIDDMP